MPGDTKPPPTGDRGPKAQRVMGKVYEKCRSENPSYSKEKCAKIGWGAVSRAGLKSMSKEFDPTEGQSKPEDWDDAAWMTFLGELEDFITAQSGGNPPAGTVAPGYVSAGTGGDSTAARAPETVAKAFDSTEGQAKPDELDDAAWKRFLGQLQAFVTAQSGANPPEGTIAPGYVGANSGSGMTSGLADETVKAFDPLEGQAKPEDWSDARWNGFLGRLNAFVAGRRANFAPGGKKLASGYVENNPDPSKSTGTASETVKGERMYEWVSNPRKAKKKNVASGNPSKSKKDVMPTTSTDPYGGKAIGQNHFIEVMEQLFNMDLDYDGDIGDPRPQRTSRLPAVQVETEPKTDGTRRDAAGIAAAKMVKADNSRWFEGWGSVEIKDKQNDLIPMQEFIPLIPLIEKRYNRIFDSHTDLMIGELNKIEIRDKEIEVKDESGNVRKETHPGLWFRGVVYDDFNIQDQVWDQMKAGTYKGFSLRGGANDMKLACSDSTCSTMHRIPHKMEITAFSVVRSPANQEATLDRMNMMAKGSDEHSRASHFQSSRDVMTNINEYKSCKVCNPVKVSKEFVELMELCKEVEEAAEARLEKYGTPLDNLVIRAPKKPKKKDEDAPDLKMAGEDDGGGGGPEQAIMGILPALLALEMKMDIRKAFDDHLNCPCD